MTQKTFLLKNKALAITLSIVVIISLVLVLVPRKYNYNYFIKKIEETSGLQISKKGKFSISFFPKIYFVQNNLEISKTTKKISLISREITLEIVKEYWDLKNTKFKINSPSTVINGIPFRNVIIEGNYQDSKTNIKKFLSDINEGNLLFSGDVKVNNKTEINLDGNFKNISLTRILNQSHQIEWKRLNIKLRSNFHIDSFGKNEIELIKNLNATLPVEGLFYINATQEERFGTALLNVLTTKIPELSGISKSLDFLITKYADIPSQIKGLIIIKNGILKTEKLSITNDNAKMSVDMSYDILEDKINGTLSFFEDDKIYLKTKLSGSINNPQILIGGKPFINNNNNEEPLDDIKKIIEEGITNIFQNILENNN